MMLALPLAFAFAPPSGTTDCDCPSISNLQKTGQASGSISWSWNGSLSATRYETWYVRRSDNYTCGPVSVTSTAHSFTGLAAGDYTFYFQAMCGDAPSQVIGVEDIIEN